MRLIKPKVEILDRIDSDQVICDIARVARTCYKSEDRINREADRKLVKRLIESKHEAMLEFVDVTVKFTTSIGITREIIRHRMASFANESTRYCNYSKDKFDNELTFIIPTWVSLEEGKYNVDNLDKIKNKADFLWAKMMLDSELTYLDLTILGRKAEQAREVLPMSTKSELCMKANLREWRHFFKLRCHSTAHPDIRVLTLDLLKQMHEQIPIIFDDLYDTYFTNDSEG